jgi:hypothetical protein
MHAILKEHIKRYPRMQPDDLYKLIMQAAMGSEHAIDDPESAKLYLQKEVEGLSPEPDDPLIDPLSPDGLIVRVNLRPFLKVGGDLEELCEAFIRTAAKFTGKHETLRSYLQTALDFGSSKTAPVQCGQAPNNF